MLHSQIHMTYFPRLVDGGSADPETNHSLAAVLKKAKEAGVPSANIYGAIEKVH
jgi:transcriptional/translational regulatory protein YebC/TACO1